ncbi:MAG: glucose-1-phosphate thymidylyltransferase [Candidatus Wolframiiraptor sp. EX4484-121]|nr:MAG: glucose-1-phosphate thymidylyltransferase [Candidatus Wolframiiraptor sp. EX4484-121]
MMVEKAVILARGLGTRMQRPMRGVRLEPAVEEFAEKGWKPFIPIGGRPFLDYTIQGLMKAGIKEVCLVIGPEHAAMREYYTRLDGELPEISIDFAIQAKPLGTADAVYAAKEFVGKDSFLTLNGDNIYRVDVIKTLLTQKEDVCYGIGFEEEHLIANSNFTSERIKSFAVMEVDEEMNLLRIVEKPPNPEKYVTKYGILVNMNLWRFTPHIFWACERIKPHPTRKEYELTSAVQLLVDERIIPVKIIPVKAGVLDITYRSDIISVREKLREFGLLAEG